MKISDLNDNSPQFLDTPYSLSLAEDTKVGARVFTGLRATDMDHGSNGQVQGWIFCWICFLTLALNDWKLEISSYFLHLIWELLINPQRDETVLYNAINLVWFVQTSRIWLTLQNIDPWWQVEYSVVPGDGGDNDGFGYFDISLPHQVETVANTVVPVLAAVISLSWISLYNFSL